MIMAPLLRAFAQLDDPAILRVLLESLAWTALTFVLLLAGAAWLLHDLAGLPRWWHAGLLGAILAAALAYLLFVPVAAGIAVLFSDRIAAAVERQYYPLLPAPVGASLAVQGWDGISLGGRVLLAHAAALVCALSLPGVGVFLGWGIAAWAIGRGLFMVVAMRRAARPQALSIYRGHRVAVLLQGGLLTLVSIVPLLNLLVPVLGIAMMVHVLHQPVVGRTAGTKSF